MAETEPDSSGMAVREEGLHSLNLFWESKLSRMHDFVISWVLLGWGGILLVIRWSIGWNFDCDQMVNWVEF